MKITAFQKEVLLSTRMSKIKYCRMYEKRGDIGYTTKGDGYYYDICIASDAPSSDVKAITLIHEAGHIYFSHIDIDFLAEFKAIEKLVKESGKSLSCFQHTYGGPKTFLNICMDCEVNSKCLTLSNLKTMNKLFTLCTPQAYNVEVLDNFRDYYMPLINKLSEEKDSKGSPKPNCTEDIPSNDTFDDAMQSDELSPEFKDLLRKELAADPTEKALVDDLFGEQSMKDLLDSIKENQEDAAAAIHGGDGASGHMPKESMVDLEVKPNTNKVIEEFLKSIINPSVIRVNDSMRIHNRGSRGNNGLFYSTSRRIGRFSNSDTKLGIIVDVSSSMDVDSIATAAGALKASNSWLNPESALLTWSTYKSGEYALDRIPSHIRISGGTNLAPAIKELSNRGFTDIVVYSDFGTDMDAMVDALNHSHAKLYSIIVGGQYTSHDEIRRLFEEYYKSYFKKTKYIYVR